MASPEQPRQQLPPAQTAPQLQVPAVTQAAASTSSSSGDNLLCLWVGCGERATTPEQLYEHVCERHVGRKSTNNLNLTCSWGTCHTTTVKRDHITSHIRVHVPLKPHKCDFCGKSFKRPQDLKKHVKTHADDSVIIRSPEPSNSNRHHQNGGGGGGGGYNNMPNQARPAGYFGDNSMQQGVPVGYGYQGHNGNQGGYYAPTQQPSGSGYGPVTYYNVSTGGESGNQASFDTKSANDFFGAVKSRALNPNSYQDFRNELLSTFQGIQLPQPYNSNMGSYQQGQPMVSSDGGVVYASAPHNFYSLPTLPNLRTKDDLLAARQALGTMANTIYEVNGSPQTPGIAPQGSSYPVAMPMASNRNSNSPNATHLGNSHYVTTPDLTPASTIYGGSSHSPSSVGSVHGVSPPSSAALYPVLPSGSSSTHLAAGMAPSSTLGTQFEHDIRRRHSGGTLQKAQPAASTRAKNVEADDMEMDSESRHVKSSVESTPPSKHTKRPSVSKDLIDPALSGDTASDSIGSPTPPATTTGLAGDDYEKWVQSMQIVEKLMEALDGRLERGEFEEGGNMMEELVAAQIQKQPESLYPVLRA